MQDIDKIYKKYGEIAEINKELLKINIFQSF